MVDQPINLIVDLLGPQGMLGGTYEWIESGDNPNAIRCDSSEPDNSRSAEAPRRSSAIS